MSKKYPSNTDPKPDDNNSGSSPGGSVTGIGTRLFTVSDTETAAYQAQQAALRAGEKGLNLGGVPFTDTNPPDKRDRSQEFGTSSSLKEHPKISADPRYSLADEKVTANNFRNPDGSINYEKVLDYQNQKRFEKSKSYTNSSTPRPNH